MFNFKLNNSRVAALINDHDAVRSERFAKDAFKRFHRPGKPATNYNVSVSRSVVSLSSKDRHRF